MTTLSVDDEFIKLILCQPTKHMMAKAPSTDEVSGAVAKFNGGESPGMDGLNAKNFEMCR